MEKKPHRSRRMIAGSLLGGLAIGVLGQIAFGFPPVTRGWEYGGENCGCYNNNCENYTCCYNCCGSWALIDLTVTQGDLDECQNFCLQAGFPCQP